jgi:hypothetical protein
MFLPRRLRKRSQSSLETITRNPSDSSSNDHPEAEGSRPERASIRSGSRRSKTLPLRMEEREIELKLAQARGRAGPRFS